MHYPAGLILEHNLRSSKGVIEGINYFFSQLMSRQVGELDYCGGELIQRADDNLETVTNRIDVYESQTKPLIDYYEKAGNIAHIDGTTGLDNVFADIVKALGE